MNKGLQIFLLVLLFGVASLGGYVIGDIVFGEKREIKPKQEDVVIEPVDSVVVTVSPVPVILEKVKPVRSGNNIYSLTAKATVESGDELSYELYKEADCINQVAKSQSGSFANISYSVNGKYYLRVVNSKTNDVSEVQEISGFTYVQQYTKLTSSEIEHIVNNLKKWSSVGDDVKKRVCNDGHISISVTNLKSGEIPVSSMSDLCSKVNVGTWKSITVTKTSYDSVGRLSALTIMVNY